MSSSLASEALQEKPHSQSYGSEQIQVLMPLGDWLCLLCFARLDCNNISKFMKILRAKHLVKMQ